MLCLSSNKLKIYIMISFVYFGFKGDKTCFALPDMCKEICFCKSIMILCRSLCKPSLWPHFCIFYLRSMPCLFFFFFCTEVLVHGDSVKTNY